MRRFAPITLLLLILIGAALALAALRPWMKTNRGIFHHLQGEHERAIEILSQQAIDPPDFLPLKYLVASLMALGQDEVAIETLRAASRAHPEWAAPRYQEAIIGLRRGQWEAVWPQMAIAADLHESGIPLNEMEQAIAMATLSLADGSPQQALLDLSVFAEDRPASSLIPPEELDVAEMLRALALLRLDTWREAATPLARSISLEPNNPLTNVMQALVMASQGQWHEARHQVDVARSIDPLAANSFLFTELNRQIALANSSRSPGLSPAALKREDAIAWLADMMADAAEWDNLIALVESQPDPERLTNHHIWAELSIARFFDEDTEGQVEARERAFEINPSWPFDPTWPLPINEVSPHMPHGSWVQIPFPDAEALPEGTQRGGERGDHLNMFSNSSVDLSVEVEAAGWHRVTFLANGLPSNGIWPILEISVPGAPPVFKYLNNQRERYHITLLHLSAGTNLVRISYVNDTERLDRGEDRNAVLRSVWIEPDALTMDLP